MADQKNSKPLMSGFMMSTQLLEVDGCNRCQECMKWCPTFAVRPDRPGITPMYKNARWRELMAKSHSLRAKIFGAKPLNDDEMKSLPRTPIAAPPAASAARSARPESRLLSCGRPCGPTL